MPDLDELFAALAKSDFRRRQKLDRDDQTYLAEKTLPVVLEHARDFVLQRLAPANPTRDGKQTPWRGHPAFVAQHATATCCRGCLAKWHRIPQGVPLTDDQVDHVLAVLARWLREQNVEPQGSSGDATKSDCPPTDQQGELFPL